MNYNDEFDDEYDDDFNDEGLGLDAPEPRDIPGEGKSKGDLDPLDITNPVSAYFFLSDDVQDEIQGSGKRKMKCLTCGHRFMGESYDSCPECYSSMTEESGYDSNELDGVERPNMKCITCGHKFIGEIYDGCPECFSADIEETIAGIDEERDEYP